MTSFKSLQAIGGFVKKVAIKKEVIWKREDKENKFDVFVKTLSAGEAEKLYANIGTDSSTSATVISSLICTDESGNMPLLTYEQAYQLEPSLSAALINAINETRTVKN